METNTCSPSGSNAPKRKKDKTLTSQQMLEATVINSLIKDALAAVVLESKEKMYKEDCAKAVISVLAEFLRTYILIGYDFEGTPIKIINAHNGLEADALVSAMQKCMINLHVNSVE
jgi:hypothetical protein